MVRLALASCAILSVIKGTKGQCGMADAMPSIMACATETQSDALFCESACYAVLGPFMEACDATGQLNGAVMGMLGVGAGMMDECSSDGQDEVCGPNGAWENDGECDTDSDPQQYCPAGTDLADCASSGGHGGGPAPVCDLMGSMNTCQVSPPDMTQSDDQQCTDPCLSSLMACLGNAQFEAFMETDQIQGLTELQQYCDGDDGFYQPDITHDDLDSAGNDICEMQGPGLATCDELDDNMDDMEMVEFCEHPCIREIVDCIDDPVFIQMMGGDVSDFQGIQAMCSSTNTECGGILMEMGDSFDEECCPRGVCPVEGLPTTCSQTCSDFFTPIWSQCGDTINAMTGNTDVSNFVRMCPPASTGGHTPPPPPHGGGTTCVDDPSQILASVGYTCTSAYSMIPAPQCTFDLGTAGIPNVVQGTMFQDMCPQTCQRCH